MCLYAISQILRWQKFRTRGYLRSRSGTADAKIFRRTGSGESEERGAEKARRGPILRKALINITNSIMFIMIAKQTRPRDFDILCIYGRAKLVKFIMRERVFVTRVCLCFSHVFPLLFFSHCKFSLLSSRVACLKKL